MMATQRPRKRPTRLATQLAVGVALCAILVRWINLDEFTTLLGQVSWWVVAAGIGLGFLRLWLMSARWWLLERADSSHRDRGVGVPSGVGQLSLGACFHYKWAASAVNLFAPAALGTDIGRMTLLAQDHAEYRLERSVVIAFDRLIGMSTIALLGLVAGLLTPRLDHRWAYLLVVGSFMGALMVLLFGAQTRAGRTCTAWLRQGWGPVGVVVAGVVGAWATCSTRLGDHRFALAGAVGISVLAHGVSFSLVYLAALAFGAEVPFGTLVPVTAISWLVTSIPVGFGGLGLRELSFTVQLAPQGVSPAVATAISLFQFAVILIIGALGAAMLAFSEVRAVQRQRKLRAMEWFEDS